jgi:FixJ family two-component response regulator
VDDDEWVVDSLKLLLETFGFDVLSYTSGGEFFADARHRTAGCLVIDQHMRNMDGLDVVDRLQKEGIRVPTILLTGQLDRNTRQRAAHLGIASIVEKPFAADYLLELVRTALLERN